MVDIAEENCCFFFSLNIHCRNLVFSALMRFVAVVVNIIFFGLAMIYKQAIMMNLVGIEVVVVVRK